MPVEELRDPVEQPLEAAAGVRRDGDERRPLAQAAAQLATDVLDTDRGRVPLREDDERRAVGVPGDVGDGDVLLHDPLGGVDQDERDVGTLRRLERAELGVVLDPLPVAPLAPQAGRVDQDERALAALEHGVHRVAGRARDLAHDQPLAAQERVDEARLADVRPAEDRDADRVVRQRGPPRRREPSRAPRRRDRAGRRCPSRADPRSESGRRARAGAARARAAPGSGRRSCSPARAPACATRAGSGPPPRRPASRRRARRRRRARDPPPPPPRAPVARSRASAASDRRCPRRRYRRGRTACPSTRRRAPSGHASPPASRARRRRASRSAG